MNSTQAEDWSSEYLQSFLEFYIEECRRVFGTNETHPRGYFMHQLQELGQTYGYSELRESAKRYFVWLESIDWIPTWDGFLRSAEKGIKIRQNRATTKKRTQEKKHREYELELTKRKAETVEIFGNPKTLEERRQCNDFLDSYNLIHPAQREKSIAEGSLTDEPPIEKIGWRCEIIKEKNKPGAKLSSLSDYLKFFRRRPCRENQEK